VKLVMNEAGSKEARATVANILKKGYTLYTVDLALAEGLNVIWKHAAVLKDLKTEEANPAVEDLARIYDRLGIVATREITAEAMQVALAQNISVLTRCILPRHRRRTAHCTPQTKSFAM
jgi:predicted nucleic acid-binding protein